MIADLPSSIDALARTATPGFDLVDWRVDTLMELLRRRAAENPGLVLYTYLEDGESKERSITAAELAAAAQRIGSVLAKFAKPGGRVILLFEDGLDYVSGLFGCLAAGLVAVSGIHPAAPRSSERLVGIVRDCAATVVLGQSHVLAEFQRALDAVLDELDLRWVASDLAKPVSPAAKLPESTSNGDLALLQYTSGSSREPRGVMLSHRNVLHNMRSQMEAFGYQLGDTGVSWLPFSHDMGLIGCVLMAVYGGGRCILLSPSHFLEDPLRWLRAVSRYRATLSAGPNFAYDLCVRRAETAGLDGLDLSSWAVAVNGAEPVRADVLRRFAEAFAPAGFRAEALRPSYGLAEATLLVTTGLRATRFKTVLLDQSLLQGHIVAPIDAAQSGPKAVELVDCGRALEDQNLRIVDPQSGLPVESAVIGEIWISGPSIAQGYFGRPADNAEFFAGDLGDGLGPYYKTGDLGFRFEDGLYVTGRLRDLLIIRGKNYYPQDLELSAESSHAAVRPGCSACFLQEETGDLVIVAELNRAGGDDVAAVSAAIRDAIIRDHGVNARRVVLTAPGSALKTPSGKIQRALTRAVYAEGRINIVHESVAAEPARPPRRAPGPVDPAEVEAWFLRKMREMGVDVATFDASMRLTDLGFDSLKIVELKSELEQDLGISMNIAELYAFQDLNSLANHLRAEVRRQQSGDKPAAIVPASIQLQSRSRLAEQRQRRGARPSASGGPTGL